MNFRAKLLRREVVKKKRSWQDFFLSVFAFASLHLCVAAFLWRLGLLGVFGQGIPEPGLVMYGVINNVDGAQTARLTGGNMVCQIHQVGGGTATLTSTLTNINDQFSYILILPFETSVGTPLSTNTLELNPTLTNFTRQITVNGVVVQFTSPAQTNFTFGLADRGLQQRVDLRATLPFPDTDNNGLPDWWETANFGHLGVDPNADPDHDGMTNLQEYRSGTNPNDARSSFAFINTTQDNQPGFLLQWSSTTNKTYSLLRSQTLLGAYSVIQTNLPATPPANTFRDTNNPPAQAFYRVLVN